MRHLIHKSQFQKQPLFATSLMLMFFILFDSMIMYILPLAITQSGINESLMGLIIGSSSLAGLIFDLVLCRFLNNTNYRRLFLIMFIAAFGYLTVVFFANKITVFLIAMILWGLYYDLLNLGRYDFVSKISTATNRVVNFSKITAFANIGYLFGPLIAGYLVGEFLDYPPFIAALIFLLISFMIFHFLIKNDDEIKFQNNHIHRLSVLIEFDLWKKIGRKIVSPLLTIFIICLIDAYYWTLTPLLEQQQGLLGGKGMLIMIGYNLPPLLIGLVSGFAFKKYHKKRVAIICILLSGLIFILFLVTKNPNVILILNFAAGFFLTVAQSSASATISDFITETPHLEKEINTLNDSFVNLGYIVGPMTAGFLGQYFGYIGAFSILGWVGLVVGLMLLVETPKKIKVVG